MKANHSAAVRRQWLRQIVEAVAATDADALSNSAHRHLLSADPPRTSLECLIFNLIVAESPTHLLPLASSDSIAARLQTPLAERPSENGSTWMQTVDALASRAKTFVDTAFATPISLHLTARVLGAHRNTVSRAFKREFGTSLSTYIAAVRVTTATRMLLHTDEKIETIAAAVGFKSRSAFSVRYRLVTGLSPSAIRRSCANANTEVPLRT